jgi:acyl-coenzyme A thioesterase PaaI-like protein
LELTPSAEDTAPTSFQAAMRGNHCYGCGKDNPGGLRINSYWDPENANASICEFTPAPYHCAGPPDVVNGGIIASLIDCHAISTATADWFRRVQVTYATASLEVNYRAPSRLNGNLRVRAEIIEAAGRRTEFTVSVMDSSGAVTAEGKVLAVRVPTVWTDPAGIFRGD